MTRIAPPSLIRSSPDLANLNHPISRHVGAQES